MSNFTYFVTQSYFNNNQNISQCTIPNRVLQMWMSTKEGKEIWKPVADGIRSKKKKKNKKFRILKH